MKTIIKWPYVTDMKVILQCSIKTEEFKLTGWKQVTCQVYNLVFCPHVMGDTKTTSVVVTKTPVWGWRKMTKEWIFPDTF